MARAAAETALLYGLLGWGYAAVCAVFRPQDMSAPITAAFPLRRDTFGCLCFAVSAAGAVALQIGTGRMLPSRRRVPGAAVAVLRTVALYSLFVWAYLCANSITHPATLAERLTHFSAQPTEGATAMLCFPLSAVSFAAARLRGARLRGRDQTAGT